MVYRLGIDIGSTTIKICLLDEQFSVVEAIQGLQRYRRHNADPLGVLKTLISEIIGCIGDSKVRIALTGSVGMGYAERLGIDFVQEVIAAAEVIKRNYPDVHTFVDMGGEDSKMIFFEEGRVPDMRMNGNCAGGTGSFIDQTATLLGVETEELNNLAAQAEQIYPIASRCGVFSKTDIQNLLARNVPKTDIAASMFRAVSMQVVSALARGMEIKPKVFLCGGPFAYLPELKKHLLTAMGIEDGQCILPPEPQLVPATGCALLAEGKPMLLSQLLKNINDNATSQITLTNTLPQLFATEDSYQLWLLQRMTNGQLRIGRRDSSIPKGDYYLGIDSGSTTTKVVLIDHGGRMVFSDYSFNNGDALQTCRTALEHLYAAAENPNELRIVRSAVTGYGENLLQAAFDIEDGIVETMAHYMAAHSIDPDVTFILDIGGQDMKAIFVEHGSIRRIEINEACSSGCGSFIMTFANRMGYSIEEFARMALYADHPYDLGTRCTVFMNSKVKQAMREGADISDIAAGLSYSVVKNCLFKVLKMPSPKELGKHIVVQGGTFKNHSVIRALERLTGAQVRFTQYPELMGAFGAALYAKSEANKTEETHL